MQHAYHRCPVTALAVAGKSTVLAGVGNYLPTYWLATEEHIKRIKIFDDQAIHGIATADDGNHALVWGGRYLRLVTLGIISPHTFDVRVGPIYSVDDWILDAAFIPSPDDSECTLGLVTAHNAFWMVRYADASDYRHESFAPDGVLERVVSGSNSILYSAHVKWLSESHCLIASGTAFGDVILWSAFIDAGKPTHSQVHFSFSAHDGSVFGVQISSPLQLSDATNKRRVLATCSDDRTIRLWDITDLCVASPTLTQIQRDTGFGMKNALDTHAPPLLAKVMGHASRIWHLRFLNDTLLPGVAGVKILSCGEDAAAIIWQMRAVPAGQKPPYELILQRTQNSHNGKNIWSVVHHEGGIGTGGADGQITHYKKFSDHGSTSGISRELLTAVDPSGNDNYKAYAFVWSTDSLLMTTEQGRIVVMDDRYGEPATVTGLAPPLLGLRGYSVVAGVSGTAFVSGTDGAIYCFTRDGRDGYKDTRLLKIAQRPGKTAGLLACKLYNDMVCLLATGIDSQPASLYTLRKRGAEWPPFEYHGLSTSRLVHPPHTVVTSFTVFVEDGTSYAVIGSRSGSILIFIFPQTETPIDKIHPVYTQDLVHGKEAITAMQVLQRSTQHATRYSTWLFSTGRDGTLAIHRISISSPPGPPSLHLAHQLALPLGPNLEFLYASEQRECLYVWGFHGKDFIQYNTYTQQEVFRVECGGVHRPWVFHPTAHGHGGTLFWTQAGTVRRYDKYSKDRQTLGDGGHGREIKAVAVSEKLRRGNWAGMQMLATGAEDTDIRIFGLRDSDGESQKGCWQVLRRHNTGIQCLRWDGLFLFSSGGFEEFFIWRVEPDVPCFKVGVMCVAEHPRSGKSDLRVCGFDVRRIASEKVQGKGDGEGDGEAAFEIWMAYSDSTLKLWRYHAGGWSLLQAGDYLTSCLSHVLRSSESDGQVITAATDGHLALWHGSNNQNESSSLTWHARHKVHQSAIHALTSTELSDASLLVATGGDDNAIALTRMSADHSANVKTLIITRAHAAAVTGLAFFPLTTIASMSTNDTAHQAFWLISAGLDQRIKLWRVTVDVAQQGVDGIEVERVQEVFTPVADVSSLEPCILDEDTRGVVVCGVGVDVWKLPPSEKEDGEGDVG